MAVKKERAFPKGAKQAEILERPVNIITFFSKKAAFVQLNWNPPVITE